jgi:hypothetical protein
LPPIRVSTARTKTEARRLAGDLERRYERERLGLEVLPATGTSETLDSLLSWWMDTYSAGKPSHAKNDSTIRRHLVGAEADVDLRERLLIVARSYTGALYVDGALAGMNTNMTLHPSDLGVTINNWLGRSTTSNKNPCLDGLVDDFRLYSRALTDGEIAALYQTGAAGR